MARERSSASLGTRTIASDERLPWTKRSNFKQSALASSPSVFTPSILLIQLLRADHVAMDPERTQVALQCKAKAARFIDRVHFGSLALEFGRPAQKRLLL